MTSLKDGLPKQAFAIVGDPRDTDTWKLPHHTPAIRQSRTETTVDWDLMTAAVEALSPGGHHGKRVHATETQIIDAARHLAAHYRMAGRPLPDTLAVLT